MIPQATELILTLDAEGVTDDWLIVGWETGFGGYVPVGVRLGDGPQVGAQMIVPTGAYTVKYLL